MYIPEELRQYVNEKGEIDLEKTEISQGWTEIADGQYIAKVTAVDVQEPKPEWNRQFSSLEIAYTIQDGKFKGQDQRDWWSLEVQPPKEGKTGLWAPDVARIKQYAAAIGEPIGAFPVFEPEKARKVVAKVFGRKLLEISIKTTTYDKKDRFGKPTGDKGERKRISILGVASGVTSAPAAQPQPVDDGISIEEASELLDLV